MIPGQFDYVRPGDLDETLAILRDREGEAKLLSGGYSLIPLMKLRLAQPELLVDLRDVKGLDTIVETDDEIRIGARTTHRQIHEDSVANNRPLLADAAGGIGDPQVRNWGTIGGSVAHADPSSDWPAVLLAAKASIVCRSSTGERTIAAHDGLGHPAQLDHWTPGLRFSSIGSSARHTVCSMIFEPSALGCMPSAMFRVGLPATPSR